MFGYRSQQVYTTFILSHLPGDQCPDCWGLLAAHPHALTPSMLSSWKCNGCDIEPADATLSFRCSSCDFDLCADCVLRARQPVILAVHQHALAPASSGADPSACSMCNTAALSSQDTLLECSEACGFAVCGPCSGCRAWSREHVRTACTEIR